MVDYGTGVAGTQTFSSDATIAESVAEYENLTVESGNTVTFDPYMVLKVSDTLTLNGTITVQSPAGGAGSSGSDADNDGGNGGNAGGQLVVLAKNIEGDGKLDVSGQSGDDGGSHTDSADETYNSLSAGNDGTTYEYQYDTSLSQTTAAGGGDVSTSAGNDATGGSRGSSLREDANLKPYFEDWLMSGTLVSRTVIERFKTSSGGGGGGGNEDNSGNLSGDANFGGAGGGGGGFFGKGGQGGDALAVSSPSNNAKGAGGGGGGGAGGLCIVITDNNSSSVDIDVSGGNGGDGGTSADDHGGAGGGGGGGGFGVFFSNGTTPNLTAGGGIGGTGQTNAEDGADGTFGSTYVFDIGAL